MSQPDVTSHVEFLSHFTSGRFVKFVSDFIRQLFLPFVFVVDGNMLSVSDLSFSAETDSMRTCRSATHC